MELVVHDRLAFIEFAPDGGETEREGWIWSVAPPIKGMRAYWVLIEREERGEPLAVAVVIASRRHRIAGTYRKGSRAYWGKTAGRFVDIGTAYTETDRRTATGALTHAGAHPPSVPTRIVVKPLSKADLQSLSGIEVPTGLLQ